MLKNLTTRRRIAILTAILSIVYLAIHGTDFRPLLGLKSDFDPIKPLILAVIAYLGTFWVLFFKVKGERFITILLFPALCILAMSLISELIVEAVLTDLGQVSVLLLSAISFAIFSYTTLLTVNILNTAYLNEIPLGQAARAAQFVLTLIVSYIISFLVFSNDFFIFVRLALIFVFNCLLIYISLWSIRLGYRQRLIASFDAALLIVFATLILSAWPVTPPYLALSLTLILYICLGISLEIREIISRWIWVEYISLFVLIFMMLILVAEWGINGVLF